MARKLACPTLTLLASSVTCTPTNWSLSDARYFATARPKRNRVSGGRAIPKGAAIAMSRSVANIQSPWTRT
jgi:hypothetical protein